MACEDDHYVVVAGTFEKLVEQLACEEKPGKHTHVYTLTIIIHPLLERRRSEDLTRRFFVHSSISYVGVHIVSDARFVTTFLLGYRHFATTMEFLTKLLERYPPLHSICMYITCIFPTEES